MASSYFGVCRTEPAGQFPGSIRGWQNFDPTITFFFTQAVNLSRVRVNYDIANSGGVAAPGSATIDGTTYSTAIPRGTSPFW